MAVDTTTAADDCREMVTDAMQVESRHQEATSIVGTECEMHNGQQTEHSQQQGNTLRRENVAVEVPRNLSGKGQCPCGTGTM